MRLGPGPLLYCLKPSAPESDASAPVVMLCTALGPPPDVIPADGDDLECGIALMTITLNTLHMVLLINMQADIRDCKILIFITLRLTGRSRVR